MIGVDWGTSAFRAFRIGPSGTVTDRCAAPRGILAVESGRFEQELWHQIGPWIEAGERHVLMSGMIGSRQGWQEVPYVPCPAGLPEVAAGMARLATEGLDLRLVPGLSATDASGTPEVMRGEETQILGVLGGHQGAAIACLPGSHSKWARVEAGRILGFETYFSGEVFAALRLHTILGRLMRDSPTDFAAFDQGVGRAGGAGHLLHQLFGVRTLGLFGHLTEEAAPSYLSGLLIGHEVRAARLPDGAEVHLIGAAALCELYARAIRAAGSRATVHDGEEAAERGLVRLGRTLGWA